MKGYQSNPQELVLAEPGSEQAPAGASQTRSSGGVVERKYYYLGGRRIAVRVEGDQDPNQNGLFYFHSDHLGSTSVMSNESGAKYGDPVRYYPFGEQRSTGKLTDLPTDHGFTGHKHNDSLGLIYMNARFYVPGIGRFASADSIVPNPADPQSLNRYSYRKQ